MDAREANAGPNGIPDLFRPVFEDRSDEIARLGKITGPAAPFFGFGEENQALPMEHGLLVFRWRVGRYSVVPALAERGNPVDLLEPPSSGSVSVRDLWREGKDSETLEWKGASVAATVPESPLSAEERNRFAELLLARETLKPIVSELDWYRNNSAKSYESRRNALLLRLEERTRTLREAESKLEESKRSKNAGLFVALKNAAINLVNGPESQVRQARRKVEETREAIDSNEKELRKHEQFPLDETISSLVEAEGVFHQKYRDFCLIRHFHRQFEIDIGQKRSIQKERSTLLAKTRLRNEELANEIARLEQRLPELRRELQFGSEEMLRRQNDLRETESANAAIEAAFRESFASLVGESFERFEPEATAQDNPSGSDGTTDNVILSFRCPNCGGTIAVKEDSDDYIAVCPSCGTAVDVTELDPES